MEAGQVEAAEPYLGEDATPKGRRRTLLIALAIGAVAILAAWFLFGRGPSAAEKAAAAQGQPLPAVTVMVPGRSAVSAVVSATGNIAARREMPVGIAGEGGMVAAVLVEPGQWVRAGQPLATIERSVERQQASALAAGITVARADAALAQSELDRAKALVARGFISKADIDRKTAARDQAVARVAVARAQLAEQTARLGRLVVRSPAEGLVLTRSVEPGQVVSAGGSALFRVAKGGQMELLARVAEADLAKMRVGMPAEVTPVGSPVAFKGEIWQLSPVIDPQNRQGVIRIALSFDRALRPGGFASTRIAAGSTQAPLLPESAVLSDEQGSYVYIVGPGDAVERRGVRIGAVDDRGVTVLAGLTGAERVVVSAGAFLHTGDKIAPTLQARS